MKTSIRKTWQGLLPIRDVFVNRAINLNEPLEVICEKKKYIIPLENLRKPVMTKTVEDYIHGGFQKLLYFAPAKPENLNQNKLPV